MKAYRVEILVIDFDDLGADGVKTEVRNARYPNRCIIPDVMAVDEAEIGDWSDDHPLNNSTTAKAEYARLFSAPAPALPEVATCVCGEPATVDIVHRKSGPCYVAEVEALAADIAEAELRKRQAAYGAECMELGKRMAEEGGK